MKHKQTQAHKWKKGRHWLYSAGVLALLVGGGTLASALPGVSIHVAAASLPSSFNQVGSIRSAPLYQTSDTSWATIQKGVDSLAKNVKADYVVGAVSKDGKGQAVGWWDGQTSYAGTPLGSLVNADPSDLTQPSYLFVKNAIMSSADGFTDSDNFNYVDSSGQYVGIHNVGQAYEVSTGKYIPIGLKLTIDDATYYDGVNAAPRDVFGDNLRLMVAARNDGAGNITMGYVVVFKGVPAVDNGGGGEGGGGGDGSGGVYGGSTLGIPESVSVTVTYINENTGQALPNNSLSLMKVADVDASQRAQVGSNALGYIISNPSNLKVDDNALTANDNTVVQSPGLSKNSFLTIKTTNSFGLVYTDTFGNQKQGSIIMALFGKNAVTLPTPEPELVKNVLTKTQASASYPAGLSQAGSEFKLRNTATGAFLKASDAVSSDKAIKATNGTLGTASDGSLKWTTGADGKVGVLNAPARDKNGDAITWEWVEVKAPKGEAITSPDGNQDFKGNLDGTPDTDENLATTGTTIKDQPIVETGIAKVNADSNGSHTGGMPDLSGAEFTLKDAKGDILKQSQGLDPQTGKQANVTLSFGAKYAPSANGNIVLVTNSQGVAGVVSNLDLPSSDGLQWVETKAPNGFAINDNPAGVTFAADNAIDSSNNNVMDNKANSSKISDKPLFEASLDKDSTNPEFNQKLGDAVYELRQNNGTAVKQNQGLDPKTGEAANVVITKGTFVSNPAGNLQVKLTDDGLADVKNLDGTLVSKDVEWVEINPASGHALNQDPAPGSFDKATLSSDKTNFLATSQTADKPLGETEIAKLDADTKDNTTQGAATLQGAEFTLVDTATKTPVKQSQGVDPKTGLQADVVLRPGSAYAPDANGNIVLVTNATGVAGGVQNLDLSNNLNYQWIETKAPYGYTINNQLVDVNFASTNKVDNDTNNYKDDKELASTISDRVVDFSFSFLKAATDNGATFLNGAEFTLSPLDGTKNSLGQFDNGKDTNINGQDTTINPDTGLATPVTGVNQLYLGAVQTSHDWTDPQGGTSAGRVEYDHVQIGRYLLTESKVPDGYDAMHDLIIEILPETVTTGAPTEYEFKVTDKVTGNVLRDAKIPVAYSTTDNGRQLINNNNFLGNFTLGSIFDHPTPPPVPSVDVEKANSTTPKAGLGNDTDKDNNAGANDHDTKETALNVKDGQTTAMNFLFTNNGEDDLEQLQPRDKTTNGSVSVQDIVYTYKGKSLKLNDKGILVNEDGSSFILKVGESFQGVGELPALPAGELHTDRVTIDAVGVKSKTPVHDHDDWNGETPKPSIDIEKANSAIPDAGKGNHQDADNNVKNDHDTAATLLEVKDKATTNIDFRATNNGTETLSHLKVTDATTDGSVSIQNLVWTFKGQTLKTNSSGELITQDGQLLNLAPGEFITGLSLLSSLPAGELHGDKASITGIGVITNKTVGDDDKWYGKVKPNPSIDVEKANDAVPDAGVGNHKDKADNVKNDHDTKETLLVVKDKQTTDMAFRLTNNGNEALTQIKASDVTTDGSVKVQKLVWSYKGQTLSFDKDGCFITKDGKALVLQPGEFLTATATLGALPAGELHGDDITVSAVGLYSKQPVGDDDKWYGKVTPKPSIDVEKTDSGSYGTGKGNNSDKDNNVKNDHDTKATAAALKSNTETEIDFNFTNTGNETLINLKPVDKTIDGKVYVTKITYTHKGKAVTLDKDGTFIQNGKHLELAPGESIQGKGLLPGLDPGVLHSDEVTITGVGKTSKTTVSDKDKYFAQTPGVSVKPQNPIVNIFLPKTGESLQSYLVRLGAILLGLAAVIAAGIKIKRRFGASRN